MVNKLIAKMLIKEELKKLPVLFYTLTLKSNRNKKTNSKVVMLNKQFYKHI